MEGYLLTFSGTSSAIRGEQALVEGGVTARVMPMPSQVSAGCGICLRVASEDRERAEALLGQAGVAAGAWYRMMRDSQGLSFYREGEGGP